MEKLVIFLTIIYIIIFTILYRLQRRTRDLSRATGISFLFIPKFDQLSQRINYVLLITNFILLIGISILIFTTFNWSWLLIFLSYVFIGTSIIDTFVVAPIIKELFKNSKNEK